VAGAATTPSAAISVAAVRVAILIGDLPMNSPSEPDMPLHALRHAYYRNSEQPSEYMDSSMRTSGRKVHSGHPRRSGGQRRVSQVDAGRCGCRTLLHLGLAVQRRPRGFVTAGSPVATSLLPIPGRAIASASRSFTGLGRVVHRRTAGPAVVCIRPFSLVIAGSGLLRAHRYPRQRRRRPGIDRLTQQLRHRVPGVVTQRPVRRDVSERPVARLPGTEGGVSLAPGDDTHRRAAPGRARRWLARCSQTVPGGQGRVSLAAGNGTRLQKRTQA
jgi:hypothetical protein